MARLVSLIGYTDSGKPIPVGVGDAESMIALRRKVINAGGIFKDGATEIQLSEMRCLATATAGGELKPRFKFTDKACKAIKDQNAARKVADAEAVDMAKAKAAEAKKNETAADRAAKEAEEAKAAAEKEAAKPKPGQKGYKPPKPTPVEVKESKENEARKAKRRANR